MKRRQKKKLFKKYAWVVFASQRKDVPGKWRDMVCGRVDEIVDSAILDDTFFLDLVKKKQAENSNG